MIQTQTSSTIRWENDIVEKLRALMASSKRTLPEIFSEFDSDRNGFVTVVEFRNAIRKLGLGLSSKDIDALLAKIDKNGDGRIDYREFANKFKSNVLDELLQ
jgi:Ca2+-binding EF-hand superfamily protein